MTFSSNQNSGSSSGAITVSSMSDMLPTKTVATSASDMCGYHASGVPHTCYECLNTKLKNGDSTREALQTTAICNVVCALIRWAVGTYVPVYQLPWLSPCPIK